jgi:hypothetical protein
MAEVTDLIVEALCWFCVAVLVVAAGIEVKSLWTLSITTT